MGHSKSLLIVIGVAFTLRALTPLVALATASPSPLFREPDTSGYVRASEQLAATGRFATADGPEIVRTPGYPLLLSIGISLGHIEAVTISLQVLLGCLTVWLVYRSALLLDGGQPAALAAAWLMACEPLSVLYASKLLSETLFTAIIALAFWLSARFVRELRWRDALAAAVAVAAAAYVRPVAYYLPLWSAIVWAVLLGPRAASRGRLALQIAAFLMVAMGLMGLWQWRNQRISGYAGFSAIAEINLYFYEAVPVLAELEGIPPERLPEFQREHGFHDRAAWLRRHPLQRDWPDAWRYDFLRAEAWRILRAHPLIAARLHWYGIAHTLLDSGRNAWVHFFRLLPEVQAADAGALRPITERVMSAVKNKPLVFSIHVVLALAVAVYHGLAVVGMAAGIRRRDRPTFLLLAFLAYFLLLSGGTAGYHRFRLPIEPLICLLAGCGWSAMISFLPAFGRLKT